MHLQDKLDYLRQILLGYGRVAIAFSGGADSSLLLKCALDTLGAGNVLVLFGKSSLLTDQEAHRAQHWLQNNGYSNGIELEVVELQPFTWKEFVQNTEERCYLCKLRIYKTFKEVMAKQGFSVLLDGTNTDDLKSSRPGLRAIHELGVKTPFVEAGFDKADVRESGRLLKVDGWQLPSASCLATRIPHGVEITEDRVLLIAQWEEGVKRFGFQGCRVRMDNDNMNTVYVQLAEPDLPQIANPDIRIGLLRFFYNNGVGKVYIDLEGR